MCYHTCRRTSAIYPQAIDFVLSQFAFIDLLPYSLSLDCVDVSAKVK